MRVVTHLVVFILSFIAAYAANVAFTVHNEPAIEPAIPPPIITYTKPLRTDLPVPEPVLYNNYRDWALSDYLDQVAPIFNISTSTAWAIIYCESEGKWTAKNPRSSAYGIFQIIDSTWRTTQFSEAERDDPYAQIDAGLFLLARDGIGHWYADPAAEKCIRPKINAQ